MAALLLAGTLAAAGAAAIWGVAPALGLGAATADAEVGSGTALIALVIMLGGSGLLLALMAAGELLGHDHLPPGR